MTFDPMTLGKKLKDARENIGLTQDQVAQTLEIPRTAIVHIESGKRAISALELTQMSKLYHRGVWEFFTEEAEADSGVVLALQRGEIPGFPNKPEFRKEVLRLFNLCREGKKLDTLLGRDSATVLPLYPCPDPGSSAEAIRQGELTAREERERLRLGTKPIRDMADLLSEQGIWASGANLPEHVSGLCLAEKSLGVAILVRYQHPRVRKRFSYAHEYCHALVDRERHLTVSAHENREQRIEYRANAFAAAFLMPADGVMEFLQNFDKLAPSRDFFEVFDDALAAKENKVLEATARRVAAHHQVSFHDVAALSLHYGTSYQSATYRLDSLGFINDMQKRALLEKEMIGRDYRKILAQALGFEDDEKETRKHSDRELNAQILHRALEAFRREEISSGKVSDLVAELGLEWKDVEPIVRSL